MEKNNATKKVMLFKALFILLIVSSNLLWCQIDKAEYDFETISVKKLKQWKAYGSGTITTNHKQVMLSETDGSVGFMLVSPKIYSKDVVLTYDIMALNAASVLVVELMAHNTVENNLEIPENYDGNIKYLFNNVNMYMFAFHNAAHNKTGPFVRKLPLPGTEPLVASKKNIMQLGKYYHVEMGIKNEKLFFKIDGEQIWFVKDKSPYKSGKIILRIRGTNHINGACLIKNIKIHSLL